MALYLWARTARTASVADSASRAVAMSRCSSLVLLLGERVRYFTLPDGRTASSQRRSFIDINACNATAFRQTWRPARPTPTFGCGRMTVAVAGRALDFAT